MLGWAAGTGNRCRWDDDFIAEDSAHVEAGAAELDAMLAGIEGAGGWDGGLVGIIARACCSVNTPTDTNPERSRDKLCWKQWQRWQCVVDMSFCVVRYTLYEYIACAITG